MAIKSRTPWWSGFAAALLVVSQSQAMVFDVYINTSGLPADTNALMAFDLVNNMTGVDHSVRIFDFATNGTLLECTDACPPYVGNPYVLPPVSSPYKDAPPGLITGSLSPGPSLSMFGTDDNLLFITYYQNITTGGSIGSPPVESYISFRFEIFGTLTDVGEPDGFSMSLLSQPEGVPLLSTVGGPLFNFSFAADNREPCETFATGTSCVRGEDIPGVPEPGGLALAMAGLFALGLMRWPRRSPRQNLLTA